MNRANRVLSVAARSRARRAGLSLVEVLMSLLIMGIGVSSLITLFPISAKRVIEATNMTNATVLRYNAEAIIDAQPGYIYAPDFPAPATIGKHYLVDPLGYSALKASGVSVAQVGTFGFVPPASVTIPLPRRYPGAPGMTEDLARALVASADTFSDQGEGLAVAGSALPVGGPFTSVTLDPNVDLSALNGLNLTQIEIRASLFDSIGDRSEVRRLASISQPAPHTLTWAQALPSNFTNIGRVVVASNEEYYTWMLSVHRHSSGQTAKVEVVVFVKRPIGAKDANSDGVLDGNEAEQVYSAKLVRLVPGTSVENNRVTIDFTGPDKPVVKRGGYLFDTKNCLWYRVSSIVTEAATSTSLTVSLEESIRKDNTEDRNKNSALDPKEDANNNGVLDGGEDVNGNGLLDGAEDVNGNNTIDEGGVIVMRGVVGVFPLALKHQ